MIHNVCIDAIVSAMLSWPAGSIQHITAGTSVIAGLKEYRDPDGEDGNDMDPLPDDPPGTRYRLGGVPIIEDSSLPSFAFRIE